MTVEMKLFFAIGLSDALPFSVSGTDEKALQVLVLACERWDSHSSPFFVCIGLN